MKVESKTFAQLSGLELYGIMRLRQEVFVVEQNCPYLDADGVDITATHLFMKGGEETGHTVVAYARLYWDESLDNVVKLGRVVTAESLRKQGVGGEMVEAAIAFTKNHYRPQAIRIHAQEYALGFYGKYGFITVGDTFLEDNIPHRLMVLPLEDT